MKRRNFLTASAVTAAAAPSLAAMAAPVPKNKEYIEWREYKLLPGAKKGALQKFVGNTELPALKRLGCGTIGAFTSRFGGDSLSLYMAIPYPSLEAFATAGARLAEDDEYLKAGADVLNVPISDPAYVRIESSLLIAFDEMPKIEAPLSNKDRIFELRVYESHNRDAARRKVKMFNSGEIDIFRKTGLKPIFFGESITGMRLPNLTYMVGFENMEAHAGVWAAFGKHPDWNEIKSRPEFKDTVSRIHNKILRPTSFSEV